MNFHDINFKEHYDSQKDDLLNDFYIPALSNTKRYKRVVGYFNSKSLSLVAMGLKDFILNNGQMDLLCGVDLDPEDVNMVKFASEKPNEILTSNFLSNLDNIEDEIERHHVEVLGWMIAHKLLRIRVAVKIDENGVPKAKEAGILHYKIGLMYDFKGNLLSFSGSINETAKAWKDNLEEFHLFRSWKSGELNHLKENLDTFNDLWNSKQDSYKILDIPTAVEEKLIDLAPKDFGDLIFHEKSSSEILDKNKKKESSVELYPYQIKARDAWLDNDKRGIFEMATGTGKTFTALGCLDTQIKENDQLVTVITVPTKHLIPQWTKSIDSFGLNYDKLLVASGDTNWRITVEEALLDLRLKIIDKLIIITTHDTLASTDFINLLKSNKRFNYFLIGDEMHGLGSNFRSLGLIEEYDFRLGLSATPKRFSDEESDFLFEYFGDSLFELTLHDAIYNYFNPMTNKSYLTPYNYYPYFLSLNQDELEDYKKLTLSLFKCSNDDSGDKNRENLLFKRANIIKDAENKFQILEEILDGMDDYSGLIVYCSTNQINKVLSILADRNIICHKFTMEEGTTAKELYGGLTEREYILDDFSKGNYQALVAMHCLDEGVDVPSASKAIFMCSSNSSREFIQRIGRVIRRYEGKTHADIYDMIVKPSGRQWDESLKKFELSIFEKEKNRYEEIGYSAENYDYVIDELNKYF